jgi:signal transduction histidine kinase/CheY-like chemotaxis protein
LPFHEGYRDHLLQRVEHLGVSLRRIESYRAKEATALERDNLLSKAPIAAALLRGPGHVFELANDRYCRMVDRFDLVGKTYREAFPEPAGTDFVGVLDRVYRTGKPFSSGEMLVPRASSDGTTEDSFFTLTLDALRGDRGYVYGIVAVAVDITEQVNARRSVERAQSEREGLLAELEAANRAKDEFLAMLGHELRNPLSPIVTAVHLMKRRGDIGNQREQEIIERHVGHVVRLVDDLLDVSKITRGKVVLRKEPVEMVDVVAKAVEIASDLLEQRRHRLTVDVPPVGLRVDGDPVRLAQVLANLLTNAARYTEPGGLVSVRAARDGQQILVAVKDNGVGIAPDLLPRVFDLFVQGARSTDRKEGGLGLGLALVKSLVLLHGGAVVARSGGIGAGSEFEIRLPGLLRDSARRDEVTQAPVAKVAGASRRVLVVDDNVDSAEMLREVLQAAGHEVALAHDGPAALAVVEHFAADIALLDIGLPVMDGYELGKRLRERSHASSCRLIALSGYGQEHDRAQSKASGFEAHFVKPVDIDRLLLLVGG